MTESVAPVRVIEETSAYWRVLFDYPPFNIVDATIFEGLQDLLARMDASPRLRVAVFEIWGASKIHGELLKLGIEVAQSTVSIYMVPRRDRPLQTWKTFVRNHMEGIAAIDLFVVPTIAAGTAGPSAPIILPI